MKLKLGENIRKYRRALDLTQEEVAEQLGVSVQSVSRWETGQTYPDLELLPALAALFDINVDGLFCSSEEEIRRFCDELFGKLEQAAGERDIPTLLDILRQIRRNLRQYQTYFFWGIYSALWNRRLDTVPEVLAELRLLTEEIFRVCPRNVHEIAVEWMSEMEDEEHIGPFLDQHATFDDHSRHMLLLNRYRVRGEMDRHEPQRMFRLWYLLSNLLDVPRTWLPYGKEEHEYNVWYLRANYDYLNRLCGHKSDPRYPISGNGQVDLWCAPRIRDGLRLAASLFALKRYEEGLVVAEDAVSLLEAVMKLEGDKFALGCSSPALAGFQAECAALWLPEDDGLLHKELYLSFEGWDDYVIPHWFTGGFYNWNLAQYIVEVPEFAPIYVRREACVITKQKEAGGE